MKKVHQRQKDFTNEIVLSWESNKKPSSHQDHETIVAMQTQIQQLTECISRMEHTLCQKPKSFIVTPEDGVSMIRSARHSGFHATLEELPDVPFPPKPTGEESPALPCVQQPRGQELPQELPEELPPYPPLPSIGSATPEGPDIDNTSVKAKKEKKKKKAAKTSKNASETE